MHTSHYLAFSDFFDEAEALRSCFDRFLSDPYKQNADTSGIWNYWWVPGHYAYFRTKPGKLFEPQLYDRFRARLNEWATENLGLYPYHDPLLSMYLNGCGQELHNDSKNGQLGYVYSLTRWNTRDFLGGETLVFKEESYWNTEAVKRAGAGGAFYDLVPAHFNQLLLFDDRLLHAVPYIRGSMDPFHSRLVIHGHLSLAAPSSRGFDEPATVGAFCHEQSGPLKEKLGSVGPHYHGFMTLRLEVEAHGKVNDARVLIDRVVATNPLATRREELRQLALAYYVGCQFPTNSSPYRVTLPLSIDQ